MKNKEIHEQLIYQIRNQLSEQLWDQFCTDFVIPFSRQLSSQLRLPLPDKIYRLSMIGSHIDDQIYRKTSW